MDTGRKMEGKYYNDFMDLTHYMFLNVSSQLVVIATVYLSQDKITGFYKHQKVHYYIRDVPFDF